MRVVVTGGAGLHRQQPRVRAHERGADITVIDDLSTGSMDNMYPGGGFRRIDVTAGPEFASVCTMRARTWSSIFAAQVSVAKSSGRSRRSTTG